MPVTIRCAALDDIPAIVAIEQPASTAPHWTNQQYDNLVEGGIVLVAEDAGQLCGFLCANTISGEWEIENIVVARRFQRRGIADELLRSLIQQAETEAASAIHLEVRESNLPARTLYEKHSFRHAGRRRMYYQGPDEDAILYTRRLNGPP